MMRPTVLAATLAALCFAAPASADPKQELADAFRKAMANGSFISVINTEGRRATQVEMRAILPDRFHMKTPDTEMIILPNGTWMNANGQWMQFPMNMSKMIEGYSARAVDEGMASLRDVRVIGTDTVEGCESTVYAYRTEGKFMGVESKSDAEAAVCGSTGMPVRVVTRDRKGKTEATITYDFTSKFEIRAPN
jgi:outer membrane lipoprotein-sorting protein